MMDRRKLIAGAVSVLAAPLATEAQQAGKTFRLGVLVTGTAAHSPAPDLPSLPAWKPFLDGMRELGYVYGQHFGAEVRSAQGRPERLPRLATELVALDIDVILANSTPDVLAAKNATSTVPIVMTTPGDPVGDGLVASLARPGGNLTGLTLAVVELSGKRLEILKETVPRLRRVAVFTVPGFAQTERGFAETQAAARRLGVQVQRVEVGDGSGLQAGFNAAKRNGADGVIVQSHTTYIGLRARISELAIAHRLPTMFSFRDHVEAGGLMAYGVNIADLARRAAAYVDKILRGAKPADLPIQQPTKWELVINIKTAKALGLTIPPSVLARAPELIE
jgi:putative ABC transport system substrate-binding protein